jgi:hypothetical protein
MNPITQKYKTILLYVDIDIHIKYKTCPYRLHYTLSNAWIHVNSMVNLYQLYGIIGKKLAIDLGIN